MKPEKPVYGRGMNSTAMQIESGDAQGRARLEEMFKEDTEAYEKALAESTETGSGAESATCGTKYVITDENLREVAATLVDGYCTDEGGNGDKCAYYGCFNCIYDWLKSALGAEVVDKSNNKKG